MFSFNIPVLMLILFISCLALLAHFMVVSLILQSTVQFWLINDNSPHLCASDIGRIRWIRLNPQLQWGKRLVHCYLSCLVWRSMTTWEGFEPLRYKLEDPQWRLHLLVNPGIEGQCSILAGSSTWSLSYTCSAITLNGESHYSCAWFVFWHWQHIYHHWTNNWSLHKVVCQLRWPC